MKKCCFEIGALRRTHHVLDVEAVHAFHIGAAHHELQVVNYHVSNVIDVDRITHSVQYFVNLQKEARLVISNVP